MIMFLALFTLNVYTIWGTGVVEYVADCSKHQPAIIIGNPKMVKSKNGQISYINANLSFAKEINMRKMMVEVKFVRCANKEQPDTCMSLPTLRSMKACQLMLGEAYIINQVLRCTNINQCKLKQEFHQIRNCPVDLTEFKLIPLNNYFWKVYVSILDGTTELVCIQAHVTNAN